MPVVEEIEFSRWLEEQLSIRGWRPIDLANAANLPNSTIVRILNGDRRAGPEATTKIAAALNLSPEYVFRKAGLLPLGDDETADTDPTFRELIAVLKGFSDEERRELLAYAFWRFRRN